jgi:magnesium transporter
MQHLLIWQNNRLRATASIDKLSQVKQEGDTLIWLDIQDELGQWRKRLASAFDLAPITLDTMAEVYERAKFNEGRGYFYLVVHGLTFHADAGQAETPKLDIVFGPHFVITFRRAEMPWLDTLRNAVSAAGPEDNVMGRGVAYLLHAILDTLVDTYFPVLDIIDDIIDDLENVTVVNTSNEVQARIFRTKRALTQMRRVISPQVEVANSLITRTGELIPREAEPYFADVHDHLVRAFEVLDSYRDLMSGLLDVYLTTVSNRLNVIMKQLTIIATIFMPITFITGVFGQNFGHSPQVEHDGGLNFWLVLLAMGLITLGQVWYFTRRGWL